MPANSEIILSNQTHTGDSSVVTVTGEKYKGDGYYGRSDGFHTVQYSLTGYTGTINIQATLAVDPAESDWFTVHTQTFALSGNVAGSPEAQSVITNFTGNYVWIRATAEYTDGTINSIKLNH